MTEGILGIIQELRTVIQVAKDSTAVFTKLETDINSLNFKGLTAEVANIEGMAAQLDKMAVSVGKLSRAQRSDDGPAKMVNLVEATRGAKTPIREAASAINRLATTIGILEKKKGILGSLATEMNSFSIATGNMATSSALGRGVASFLSDIQKTARSRPAATTASNRASPRSSDINDIFDKMNSAFGGESTSPPGGSTPDPAVDKMNKSASEANKALQKLYTDVAHKGNTEAATAELKKYGFTLKDITKAAENAAKGVTSFNFATEKGARTFSAQHVTQTGENVSPAYVRAQKEALAIKQQMGREESFGGAFSKGMPEATEYLNKYGFAMKDLKKVTEDTMSKTRIFKFQQKAADGTIREATVGVNRYGDVVGKMSNQFKGFADMLGQNIDKVLRWSLAVGLVYGAFSKLQESFSNLIKWDEYMSDIELSTDATGEALTHFFDMSIEAAKATGTGVAEVLKIYDDALKTTRSITDQVSRLQTANNLVTNALTFSRLTGTGQTEALDILTSATRQFRQNSDDLSGSQENLAITLNRSSEMLDMWVYLSQRGSLTVRDLAESFSIVGAAAENAGVDMQTLAAMTAVMSEGTTKSATQTANTIRRLMTFMEGAAGEAALRSYGIALNDLSGRARSFDDVLTEIAAKVQAGALSGEALNKLGYSIGGGSRGMTDFVVLVESWNTVLGKAEDTRMNATGSSAVALATKSRTLQTAIANLDTAFNNLMRNLGTDGGLIDLFTGAVSGLTSLADLFSDLPTLIGGATTRMMAFAVASSMLSRYGPTMLGGITGRFKTVHGKVPSIEQQLANTQVVGGTKQPGVMGQRFKSPGALGYGLSAAYAATAIIGEEDQQGLKAAGVIGGAIASTLIGAGPLVGTALGDAISDVIITRVTTDAIIKAPSEGLQAEDLIVKSAAISERIEANLLPFFTSQTNALASSDLLGAFFPKKHAALKEAPEDKATLFNRELYKIYAESGEEAAREFARSFKESNSKGELAQNDTPNLTKDIAQFLAIWAPGAAAEYLKAAEESAGSLSPHISTNTAVEQKFMELIDEKLGTWRAQEAIGEKPDTYRDRLAEAQLELDREGRRANEAINTPEITRKITTRQQDLLSQVMAGKLSTAKYHEREESTDTVKNFFGALGPEIKDITDLGYEEIFFAAAELTSEARDSLLDQAGTLREYRKEMKVEGHDPSIDIKFEAEQEDFLKWWDFFVANNEFDIAIGFKYTGFTDATKVTEEQYRAAERAAKQWTIPAFTEAAGMDTNEFIESMDSSMVLVKDKGVNTADVFIDGFHGRFIESSVDAQFVASWLNMIVEEAADFNIERMKDFDPADFKTLQQKVHKWENFLGAVPGYNDYAEKEEFNLVLGEDPVLRRLTTTMEAFRYAMEELTDVEKKKLEGQWNIPEGATVMVPLSSLYYANKKDAESDPLAEIQNVVLDAPEITGNTLAVVENTAALQTFAAAQATWDDVFKNLNVGLATENEMMSPSPLAFAQRDWETAWEDIFQNLNIGPELPMENITASAIEDVNIPAGFLDRVSEMLTKTSAFIFSPESREKMPDIRDCQDTLWPINPFGGGAGFGTVDEEPAFLHALNYLTPNIDPSILALVEKIGTYIQFTEDQRVDLVGSCSFDNIAMILNDVASMISNNFEISSAPVTIPTEELSPFFRPGDSVSSPESAALLAQIVTETTTGNDGIITASNTGLNSVSASVQTADISNRMGLVGVGASVAGLASAFRTGFAGLAARPTIVNVFLDGEELTSRVNSNTSNSLHNVSVSYGGSSGGLLA